VERVRAILTSIGGVEKVAIDFPSKSATITMGAGRSLTRQACEDAFAKSPYGVASFAEAPSSTHGDEPET
jgi:hypothetical protein